MSNGQATASKPRTRDGKLRGFLVGLVTGLLLGGCTEAGVAVRRAWKSLERSRGPTRVNECWVEIGQIANATAAFKAKCNVAYIPDRFALESDYTDAASDQASASYLKQVFPFLDLANTGLPEGRLDGNQSLLFFLTGGPVMGYEGFSREPTRPFTRGRTEHAIGPFLDIRRSKLDKDGRYLDPWGTPYVYFTFTPPEGLYSGVFEWKGWTVTPYRREGQYLNRRGFQIISAGPNRQFGPGGEWLPGEGPWEPDGPGGDDYTNFNTSTLSKSISGME